MIPEFIFDLIVCIVLGGFMGLRYKMLKPELRRTLIAPAIIFGIATFFILGLFHEVAPATAESFGCTYSYFSVTCPPPHVQLGPWAYNSSAFPTFNASATTIYTSVSQSSNAPIAFYNGSRAEPQR